MRLLPLLLLVTYATGYPQPSQRIQEYMDMGFSMFMHYSVTTYGNEQHNCFSGNSRGHFHPNKCLKPSLFNPTHLNTDQWVQTAKNMGAGEVCLTAHHEGGFCLWPTKYSNYSVASSPYKKDILKQFVASCKKYGLRICYYMGPNANGYLNQTGTPVEEFIQIQMNMTRELLTEYGPVSRLWWDHYPRGCGGLAMCPGGFPKAWSEFITEVRKISPNTLMGTGPDVQHSLGGESGVGSYPVWNYCNVSDGVLHHCDRNKWGPVGNAFMPREADATIQWKPHTWFWRTGVTWWNASSLWDHYMLTLGRGDTFILNVPPNKTGLIPYYYTRETDRLGKALRDTFDTPVASILGNKTEECKSGTPLELHIPPNTMFDIVRMKESISDPGQAIEAYKLEIKMGMGDLGILHKACMGKQLETTSLTLFHSSESTAMVQH